MVKVTKAKLIEAFDKSIAKWRLMKRRIYHSEASPCGLCELFMDCRREPDECRGCPLHDLNDKPEVCCYEWQNVSSSIDGLIKLLEREKAKVKDCQHGEGPRG